jgi:small conductance mechanosensitive channel
MPDQLGQFFNSDSVTAHLVRIGIIIILTWVAAEIGSFLAVRALKGRTLSWRQIEERRLVTLQALVGSAVRILIWIAGVVIILFALGIPAGSILTALGLFSAGFGLGARPLINDYLAGVVLIFEDLFSVGEKVEMLDIIGTVEAVELRTTRIRSTSGELYIVPNGEVRVVRNLSRGLFSVANIKVMVATENLSSALQVLETIADTAQTKFPELTERPEVLSIEGAISNHTELTLAAKAAYGRGAQLRPQLMTIVSQAMHEAGVQIIS